MGVGIHVRRNDQVYVVAGKDRGKSGRVMRVYHGKRRVLVEGVNNVRKAIRANPGKNIKGGIVEREAALDATNVAVVCPECNSPARIGYKKLEDGSKVRICRKCGGVIDKT
ncbi:MAG: 50S ribosomal protein L24 [Acidobacteriota bacterium]